MPAPAVTLVKTVNGADANLPADRPTIEVGDPVTFTYVVTNTGNWALTAIAVTDDIEGPLAQRGWFCIEGYDTVADHLTQALADPRVTSVLLRLNSPGGAAAGVVEG